MTLKRDLEDNEKMKARVSGNVNEDEGTGTPEHGAALIAGPSRTRCRSSSVLPAVLDRHGIGCVIAREVEKHSREDEVDGVDRREDLMAWVVVVIRPKGRVFTTVPVRERCVEVGMGSTDWK